MNFRMLACIGMIALLGPIGCGDGGRPGGDAAGGDGELSGRLTLTGSSTVAPLAGEIAKRFEAQHPNVRVDVQTGGSSRGIADAHSGLADIGMSSRGLKDSEMQGVTTHVLAQDGVAFIVHADNPIEALTNDQVLQIYTGKLTNWSQVGGREAPITVINRAEGRSELELVTGFFDIKPSDIKPTLVAGENQECVKLVAGNPDALSYLSVGTAESEIKRGTPLKMLPFDGVAATTQSVKDGKFPLGRPLVLITSEDSGPLVETFVEYALSGEVNDLIEGFSFVAPR